MAHEIIVDLVGGDAYDMQIKGHTVRVDQPVRVGGTDTGPSPTDLFVASLAGCVAFYAGRYLRDHGHPDQLRVRTGYMMGISPTRVTRIEMGLEAPGVAPADHDALTQAVSHCTVHNSLRRPPTVEIRVI